jgi:O-antigen ligase
VLTFSYTGSDLLLQLALGDYWGYLYITIDGAPANRLPLIPGNRNGQGAPAGYRTFYAPELQTNNGPTPQWLWVHRATDTRNNTPAQKHDVRIEVWRGWGQTPLRAVAVDAQVPPAFPRWPFVTLFVIGIAALLLALRDTGFTASVIAAASPISNLLAWLTLPVRDERPRRAIALLGVLMVAASILLRLWWLGPVGLVCFGYAALRQPTLWAAALLFALPFYYSQTLPILPGRATNIIDAGVLGGIVIAIGAWFITPRISATRPLRPTPASSPVGVITWIIALAGWSLIAASTATYGDVALREWRTLFLAAALFALLLNSCRTDPAAPKLLLLAWIAGGVVIALIGLGQFATDARLIEAEGVHRVRSLYGSPNNLALYLERTLMPTLALLLLLPNGKGRWLALAAAAIQGSVLLLTFSKGALILGLPAGLITLWLGGLYLLRRQRISTRPLWWLAGAAMVALLALLPFLGTERFQGLFDFNSGTGFTRLQLWRSAWQMALDHPWFGVGPDNFLYAYRSGYILPAAWQEPNLNHPHTWLLDWWTRLGLVGTVLGLGWWWSGLRATWQRLHHASTNTPLNAALWLGTLAAMTSALSHGLIDLSYAVPDLMLVWVLMTMMPTLAAAEIGSEK